jgi:hypothetical protein
MNLRSMRAFGALALIAGTGWGVTGAEATEAPAGVACVATATPVGMAAPAVTEAVCFDSLAEAIEYATGGTVRFAAGTSREAVLAALPERLAAQDDAAAETVIGIDHDVDWIDEDLVWTTSNASGCLEGGSYYTESMPSGWNDKVDAATAYQGCDRWAHYEHTEYGGALEYCTCPNMGAMEDETSSETWEGSADADVRNICELFPRPLGLCGPDSN